MSFIGKPGGYDNSSKRRPVIKPDKAGRLLKQEFHLGKYILYIDR